jgi:hypothetical protein
VTTEQDEPDRDQQPPQGREVPQHPQSRQAETVDALEDQQSGANADDGERIAGDDVTQNPDDDEMEGLPGPSPDEPGESSG